MNRRVIMHTFLVASVTISSDTSGVTSVRIEGIPASFKPSPSPLSDSYSMNREAMTRAVFAKIVGPKSRKKKARKKKASRRRR